MNQSFCFCFDDHTDPLSQGEHSQDPQDVSAPPTKFYSYLPAKADRTIILAATKASKIPTSFNERSAREKKKRTIHERDDSSCIEFELLHITGRQ